MIRKTGVAAALFFSAPLSLFAASGPKPHPGMAMKPVVCRVLQEARGKSGDELAAAIEQDGAQLAASNYDLVAVLPGDAPIACYRSRVDPSKLPKGAR